MQLRNSKQYYGRGAQLFHRTVVGPIITQFVPARKVEAPRPELARIAVLAQHKFRIAVLHALAALKHHFFDRDEVLRHMLPVCLKPNRPWPVTVARLNFLHNALSS